MKYYSKCTILKSILTFLMGFCIGFLISFSIDSYTSLNARRHLPEEAIINARKVHQRFHLQENKSVPKKTSPYNGLDSGPRLLCYLLIGPSTHSVAIHVRDTWAKRCDKVIFFSTQPDDSLNTVPLKVKEGYKYLWDKSKHALKYLHQNYYSDFDWFLKADDDTYVIVENLKSFLKERNNASDPVYFGVKFKMYVKQGFMSGGGGYVFSKEALRRVVTIGFNTDDTSLCPHNKISGAEDVNLGAGMLQPKFDFFPWSIAAHDVGPRNASVSY